MSMESRSLSELKPNEKNPRYISKDDFEALKKSIQEFGDLSNLVWNETTGQLVGGHQRRQAFLAIGRDQITITERYAEPNSVGTVAVGYVLNEDERFPVRIVRWPLEREMAANIAANNITGSWDDQLLAEANYMLNESSPDLLALTGQSQEELEKSLSLVGGFGDEEPAKDASQENPEDEKMTFTLTPEQSKLVRAVLDGIKQQHRLGNEDHGSALYYLCIQHQDGVR